MSKLKTKVNIRNFDYVNSLIISKYDESEEENGFSLPYIIATTLDDKIIEISEDEDGDYSISRYSISDNETKQEMTLLYTDNDINELFKILYSVFINDSYIEYIYKVESEENEQDLLIYNLAEDTEEYDSNKEYNVRLLSVFNNLLGFTEENKYWNCDESYILDEVLNFSDVNDENNDDGEEEQEEEEDVEKNGFNNYNYTISDVKDDLFEKSITIIPSITSKSTNILYKHNIKTILDLCSLSEEEFDLLVDFADRYPIKEFLRSKKISFADKVGEYQKKKETTIFTNPYRETNESFREEIVKKEEIEYSKTIKLTSQMELIISSNEKLVNPKINIYRFDNKNEIFGSYIDEKEGKFNYKFLLPNYTIAGEYKFTIIDENIKEEKEYSLQLIKGGIVVKDDH